MVPGTCMYPRALYLLTKPNFLQDSKEVLPGVGSQRLACGRL